MCKWRMRIKIYFQVSSFELSITLRQRHRTAQKWPINHILLKFKITVASFVNMIMEYFLF